MNAIQSNENSCLVFLFLLVFPLEGNEGRFFCSLNNLKYLPNLSNERLASLNISGSSVCIRGSRDGQCFC